MDNFIGNLKWVVAGLNLILGKLSQYKNQLYVGINKQFPHTTISNNGSLCEIRVVNKGDLLQEDIKITLCPGINAKVIGPSLVGISISKSILKVDRLQKDSYVSVILLITKGVLDTKDILSASSKDTIAIVTNKINNTMPKLRNIIWFISFVCIGVFLISYSNTIVKYVWNPYLEHKLDNISKNGWRDLNYYYSSDLRKSYSNQEFPIRFIRNIQDDDKRESLEFNVYNKTAIPFTVFYGYGNIKNFVDVSGLNYLKVEPMSRKILRIKKTDSVGKMDSKKLRFHIDFGQEHIYNITYDDNK